MRKEYLDKLLSTILSIDSEEQHSAALRFIELVLDNTEFTAKEVLETLLSKTLKECQEK